MFIVTTNMLNHIAIDHVTLGPIVAYERIHSKFREAVVVAACGTMAGAEEEAARLNKEQLARYTPPKPQDRHWLPVVGFYNDDEDRYAQS